MAEREEAVRVAVTAVAVREVVATAEVGMAEARVEAAKVVNEPPSAKGGPLLICCRTMI